MKNMGDRNFELRCTCRSVEWMLKDYLRKLELDETDGSAIEKMKAVNVVLGDVGMIEQASNSGKLVWQ